MQAKDGVVDCDSPSVLNGEAHTPQEIQVAKYSRKQAFDYFNKSQFGRALAHLFVTLRLAPEWREELRDVFYQALSGGCLQLQDEGRLEETVQLRKDSLLFYPEDGTILMDLGSTYYKLDDSELALQYYHQAIQVCPSLLPASRAIQSIHNKQVERWHFRMLNDLDRNEAYYHAIAHRIREGYFSVLDVGTGTGLLSLFAEHNGAKKLWACESNPHMYKIAQSVLAANNCSTKVNLLNKDSNLISVPSDIPEKVSLLVTEVFDAGLLGEGVLPMLTHAWENLLLPPSPSSSSPKSGVVVPFSATVWAVPIQCINIARRHRLLPVICSCNPIESTVLSSAEEFMFIEFGDTRLCKFCEAPLNKNMSNTDHMPYYFENVSIASSSSEPYTTEDLRNVPFGYGMLSKPYKIFEINFNSPEDLKSYGHKQSEEIAVVIESPGSVDAIASWFHLNMDNNGTVISTAPFKEDGLYEGVCWHQAIFPSATPKKVHPGDVLNLHINTHEGVLKILQKEVAGPLLEVSPCVVSFLNNKTWIKALQKAANDIGKNFKCNPSCSKNVLDLNPFPILGLQMLNKCEIGWKLVAKAETRADEIYVLTVAQKYSIRVEQIEFVTEHSLQENVGSKFFDVICVNVMDSSGEFAEQLTELWSVLYSRLSPVGIIVPDALSIEGQLIESNRLVHESRIVSDERTIHFKIGEFINKFAVDYHLDLSFREPDLKTLSSPFQIFMFSLNSSECNTIGGQYRKELKVRPTGTGNSTGIIYWVNLRLLPGAQSVSTTCHDSHCNQSVSFTSQRVISGEEVSLNCHYCYGFFDVKFGKVNT